MIKEESSYDKYNYSIAFVKILFSFFVICIHYWNMDDLRGVYFFDAVHRLMEVTVPVFLIMSFFLTTEIFTSKDKKKIKKRLVRLVIPFYMWGILYYIGYSCIDLFLGYKINPDLSFNSLLWQITLGHSKELCPPLWYLLDSIIISIVFWSIFKISDIFKWNLMLFLLVISLGMQYSGINYRIFGRFQYEICYPLGRLAEVFPYACIGMIVSASGCLKKLKSFRLYTFVICILSLLVVAYGNLFTRPEKGFAYGGTYMIVYATLVFVLFYMIPFDKSPILIKKGLRTISKYSLGIYCIHLGVGYIWNNVFCDYFGWKQDIFVGCIAIFLISLLFAWLISKIPFKCSKYIVE